jgi:hypothetical protein
MMTPEEFWSQPEQAKYLPKIQNIWNSENIDKIQNLEHVAIGEIVKFTYVKDPWVPFSFALRLELIMGMAPQDRSIYSFKAKYLGQQDGFVNFESEGIKFQVYHTNNGRSWRLHKC